MASLSAASRSPEQAKNMADNSPATKARQMIRYGHCPIFYPVFVRQPPVCLAQRLHGQAGTRWRRFRFRRRSSSALTARAANPPRRVNMPCLEKTNSGRNSMTLHRISGPRAGQNRRQLLKNAPGALPGAAAFAMAPAVLRAQGRTIKIGLVTPTTGPLAAFAEAD